jgi:hypothetical protein
MTQSVTDKSLLRDAEILLAEFVAIFSGQQFERNPTAIVLNKSMRMRDRIRAHVLNQHTAADDASIDVRAWADEEHQAAMIVEQTELSKEDASRLIAADLNSEIAL